VKVYNGTVSGVFSSGFSVLLWKWLGVGVGVMYGTQLMILLIVHNLISTSAPPEFSDLLATVV
jgi:hypothetical protein